MNPMLIAALVQIAAMGIGAVISNKRRKDAEKDAKTAREALGAHEYVIPEQYMENLSAAQTSMLEGLPAESKKLYVERMDAIMNQGSKAMQERGLAGAGTAAIFRQQQNMLKDLLVADVTARKQGEGNVAAARGSLAGAKDAEYMIKQGILQGDVDYARTKDLGAEAAHQEQVGGLFDATTNLAYQGAIAGSGNRQRSVGTTGSTPSSGFGGAYQYQQPNNYSNWGNQYMPTSQGWLQAQQNTYNPLALPGGN